MLKISNNFSNIKLIKVIDHLHILVYQDMNLSTGCLANLVNRLFEFPHH